MKYPGLTDGPNDAALTVILAHGAGAPMDSPFMEAFATGVAAAGFQCVRFEFPYMAARREREGRTPPNPLPVLLDTWKQVIRDVARTNPDTAIVIGGKSMGGRVASMLAADTAPDCPEIAGLVCLGYPFHPAGKPEKLRIDHLKSIKIPSLFIQGTRDMLGNQEEVGEYVLSPSIHVHWLADGDHSFKPRRSSGRTEAQNWQEGIDQLVVFAEQLLK